MLTRAIAYLSYAVATTTSAVAHGQTTPSPIDTIEVFGTTPLGGNVDADRIPSNAQTATSDDLNSQHALDLADFMKKNLGSVFVNDAQNNPLQPDIQYRGFVGSPLLGLPQGIAVYQDGVRINEPFGDTVNWALIPESAIDTLQLMPGSNPLFGLNALGGAISVNTKDGISHPGTRLEVYGGSFSRVGVQAETGGEHGNGFNYFVTGSYFEEDGWRDFSPTAATQLFGKVGWDNGSSNFDVTLSYADTDLIGNGAAPVDLLRLDRTAIFTQADQTENTVALLNVVANHSFSAASSLTGNVYIRGSDIDSLNGDDSDFEECSVTPGFICEVEDGEEMRLLGASGNPIPADASLEGATINRTNTAQDGVGFSLQFSLLGDIGGRDNQFIVGLAFDDNDISFASNTELGTLNSVRLAIPGGVLLDDAFISLQVDSTSIGVYVANTIAISESLSLTAAARFNELQVTLHDQLGTALNGDHKFDRINPAIGLTYAWTPTRSIYASYSESNRAPSPVELSCADADAPCRLPNAFLADPPLEQVVAKTFEFGLRGTWSSGEWHTGVFQTDSEDDIIFISAGALTNEGFFDNVGKTRRRGVEINLRGTLADNLSWFTNYSFLDPTFRTPLTVPSPNNPAAINGEMTVKPGDRLPLIPQQLLKFGFDLALSRQWHIGANLLMSSDQPMRGDEGNLAEKIDAYTVLNFRADYEVNNNTSLFITVDNLLDQDYETFGVFGEPTEVLGDAFSDPRFLGPATPRAAWVGVNIEF